MNHLIITNETILHAKYVYVLICNQYKDHHHWRVVVGGCLPGIMEDL